MVFVQLKPAVEKSRFFLNTLKKNIVFFDMSDMVSLWKRRGGSVKQRKEYKE